MSPFGNSLLDSCYKICSYVQFHSLDDLSLSLGGEVVSNLTTSCENSIQALEANMTSAYNRVSHGDRGDGFRGRLSDDTSAQASESYGDGACSEPRTTNHRSRAPSPPHGGLEDVSDAAETHDYTPRDVSNSRLSRDNSHMRDSPVRRTGPTRRSRPAVNADEDYDDNRFAAPSETESDVFVPQVKITSRRAVRAGRVEKSRGEGRRAEKQPMYTADDLIKPRGRSTTRRALPSEPPKKKKGPSAEEDAYFNNIGRNLEDSRYSGAEMPWGVNKQPPAVPQDEVSDAALLKRGLKRGQGDKVAKRGYGANDPENIAIVNMKEQDNLSFEQIANILNTKRVEAGKNPNLTVTGCNGRYNRTAPLLFAAQGQEFVPLSQRKGHGKHGGSLQDQAVFNNDTDIELVNCVKEVDSRKWYSVASMFTERTGLPMNAKAAAIRFGVL